LEEDVVGPLKELGRKELVTCPRCGRPTFKHLMVRLPVDYAEPGVVIDYDEVCPSCWAAMRKGEQPAIEDTEE
jgi:hypothetical protein